jgi:hypothetical protein
MTRFTDLRSDYPVILTVLDPRYPCPQTWSDVARLSSARTIAVPLFRHNHPVQIRIYTRLCSTFYSSVYAPSASESPWGLTPATGSFREFQLYAREQMMSPVEHHCTNLHGSTEFDFPRVGSFFVRQISEICGSSKSHAVARLSQTEFDGRIVLSPPPELCGNARSRTVRTS